MNESELRCEVHGTATRLTCAQCDTPICPRCMRRTDVGLRCGACAAPAHSRRVPRRRVPRALAAVAVAGMGAAGAVVAIGPFSDGQASAPSADIRLDEATASDVRAVLDEVAADDPGGTVAWIDTGDEQLSAAAGQADRRSGESLTGDEAFAIADATMVITATVTLQLVEEGRLGLDQPIAEVVPQQAARFEHGDDITVRHLLGHTSGVAELTTGRLSGELADRASVEAGAVVAGCPGSHQPIEPLSYAAEQPPRFEPGADGAYTITNDALLRHVIESATGKPVARVFRERVFAPLGMARTWLPCGEQPRAEIARGYVDSTHSPFSDVDVDVLDVTDVHRPLGARVVGVMSTAGDLATFTRALVDGELFDDPTTLEIMREPHPLQPGLSYGLGLEVSSGILGHGGGRPGYSSLLRYYPSQDVVLVVLSTQSHRDDQLLARRAGREIMIALSGGVDRADSS